MAAPLEILTADPTAGADPGDIDAYMASGGYGAVRKALTTMSQAELIGEINASGIKGRGGAGFSTGMKWNLCADRYPRYLCANADESEPGSFKDRLLLESKTHQIIEGMIITSYALGINLGYIYIRGEFFQIIDQMEAALADARKRGFLGTNVLDTGYDLELYVHPGAGAYICGEETGLIESLEGNRPYPRLKPPFFPAAIGLWGQPTIVNNVETMAQITTIIEMGAEAYKEIGSEEDTTGPRLFGLCGHVKKPGIYEYDSNVTLRELIYDAAGGIRDDNRLKGVIPGGISAPILTPEEIDTPMGFGALGKLGSMGGTGGIIVMDETTSMVDALLNASSFAAHESCGQCTPCREGVPWMNDILRRIRNGAGREEDLDLLLDICKQIHGHTVCVFGQAPGVWPVRTILVKYWPEFRACIERKELVVLPVEESYLRPGQYEHIPPVPGNFRMKTEEADAAG